jgi:hypothetical protein
MASNRTTFEVLKGHRISYMRGWARLLSPFSKGLFHNIWQFISMHWTHPVYIVPQTDDQLEQWKSDNCLCANDYYTC